MLVDQYARTAHRLYNNGIRFERGPLGQDDGPGQRLWYDAEEFLETLDLAASKPNSRSFRRLSPIVRDILKEEAPGPDGVGEPIARVAAAARRLLAAECNGFTQNADLDSEKYWPYVRWMKDLVGRNDAIITFNYDFLLELLGAAVPGKIQILATHQQPDTNFAYVYKLHGSINWKHDGTYITPTPDRDFALACPDEALAIGSPGPTKQTIMAKLENLWVGARNAILAAETDCVVFVGYRFPPSDANAKQRLLTALAGSRAESFAVHVVLGPKKSADDIVRLEAMLRYVLHNRDELPGTPGEIIRSSKRFSVTVQPLWAEDFFTVMDDELLRQPWAAGR